MYERRERGKEGGGGGRMPEQDKMRYERKVESAQDWKDVANHKLANFSQKIPTVTKEALKCHFKDHKKCTDEALQAETVS